MGDASVFAFPSNALHDLNQSHKWVIMLQIKKLVLVLLKGHPVDRDQIWDNELVREARM